MDQSSDEEVALIRAQCVRFFATIISVIASTVIFVGCGASPLYAYKVTNTTWSHTHLNYYFITVHLLLFLNCYFEI